MGRGTHATAKVAYFTTNGYHLVRMARILYAVNGDGYGHATRAYSVGAAPLARGREVRFLTSLRSNAYIIVRLFYGGARRYLIPTFIPAAVRYHPTTLVDPILRPKVYEKSIEHGDFLVAYKGAGGENDAMRRTLEGYERMPIRAYGFEVTGQRRKVTYKPTTTDGFLHDLAGCAGVIMSAGHSLACECLHLEKPMLLIPIAQQYEQAVNAYHVEKLGAGRWVDRLSTEAMDEFVDQLGDGSDGVYRNMLETREH